MNKTLPEVMKEFSTCPCCSIEGNPPIYRDAKDFFGDDFPLYTGNRTRWRSKAKLAIREKNGKLVFGLFEPGTHHIVDCSKCPAHVQPIEDALSKLTLLQKLPAYKEDGSGLLRYVQFHANDKVELTIVATKKDERLLKKLDALAKDPLFQSIWLNINPKITNTIFGEEWIKISGDDFLYQNILGNSFAFHPASFSQVNLPLFEKMLLSIRDYLPQKTNLLELYSGNGVISLSLLDKCEQVFLVEKNPYSFLSFQKTKKSNEEKVVFYSSSLEELTELPDVDTLIVDPPRKGLQGKFPSIPSLQRIIYISCHFPSFKMDAEELQKKGFVLKKAEGYLFFPGSNHIEILGIFEK